MVTRGILAATLVAVLVVAFSLMGCTDMTESIDREAEIAAVKQAVHNSIEWCFPDKNRERCFAHCLPDSTFFMFQPSSGSTIKGFAHFQEYAERIFFDDRFTPLSTDIKELEVELSPHGDVAWFHCLLDDFGEWDGQKVGWADCRWTGVLIKSNGEWLLAQQHFSLASDKVREDVLAEVEKS